LIFAILEGGSAWAWSSATELVILLASLAVLGGFIVVERRSAEPMVPSWILSRRPLLFGNISALAVGAILLGLTSYIPTWAQGVRHLDPLVSGLTVASITLGWPVASALSGKVYLRIGFRGAAFIGTLIAIAGAWTFTLVRPSTPILLVALCGIFVGAGMGLASTPVMVGLSTLVGWERRGVVTASNLFARTVGSAVGIAIFGSVANSSLSRWLREAPPAVSRLMPNSVNVASSVLGGGKVSLAPQAAAYVRSGLYHATHDVFVCVVFVGVLGALAVAAMPRHLTTLEFGDEDAPVVEDSVAAAASVMPVSDQ
jgi:MFS family permease